MICEFLNISFYKIYFVKVNFLFASNTLGIKGIISNILIKMNLHIPIAILFAQTSLKTNTFPLRYLMNSRTSASIKITEHKNPLRTSCYSHGEHIINCRRIRKNRKLHLTLHFNYNVSVIIIIFFRYEICTNPNSFTSAGPCDEHLIECPFSPCTQFLVLIDSTDANEEGSFLDQ